MLFWEKYNKVYQENRETKIGFFLVFYMLDSLIYTIE